MYSTANLLWKIAAAHKKAGLLQDSDIERFFRPKIDAAHWRKMHRFKKRLEKELENV